MPWATCGGERAAFRSWFFYHVDPGDIQLWSPTLEAGTFAHLHHQLISPVFPSRFLFEYVCTGMCTCVWVHANMCSYMRGGQRSTSDVLLQDSVYLGFQDGLSYLRGVHHFH